MNTTGARRNVYSCGNKTCSQYHVEVKAMPTAEVRLATGGPVRCGECGEVMFFRRYEPVAPPTTLPTTCLADETIGKLVVKSCCADPKVRGGRCDNCGAWISDGDEGTEGPGPQALHDGGVKP